MLSHYYLDDDDDDGSSHPRGRIRSLPSPGGICLLSSYHPADLRRLYSLSHEDHLAQRPRTDGTFGDMKGGSGSGWPGWHPGAELTWLKGLVLLPQVLLNDHTRLVPGSSPPCVIPGRV